MKRYFQMAALVAVGVVVAIVAGDTWTPAALFTDGGAGLLLLAEAPAVIDPEEVKAELKKIGDNLKSQAEKAFGEIRKFGDMTTETKASVDKLLAEQGETQARLAAAEQVIAKLEAGGGSAPRPKSWGELVTESDAFKGINPNGKGTHTIDIKAAITESGLSGDVIEPQRVPGIVMPPNQRLFIRDVLSFGRTQSSNIEFVRETGFTNAADVVSENPAAGKPEANITFEAASAPVATIAHWIRASKQVLSDIPMMQSYIDGRLRYGLKLKEEAQLLKGSGVGLNIDGLVTQAEAYANPGVVVQDETLIDRVRLALLQAELAEYYADAVVLNPIEWTAIELTKDSENRYIFANPVGLQTRGLWARPVVPTQSMSEKEFLVGAFMQGAQGWDREDVTVIVSLEDRDNVIKNMVTILVEERLALTVYRPEAFVTGNFDDLIST